jgi:hypothetical protein
MRHGGAKKVHSHDSDVAACACNRWIICRARIIGSLRRTAVSATCFRGVRSVAKKKKKIAESTEGAPRASSTSSNTSACSVESIFASACTTWIVNSNGSNRERISRKFIVVAKFQWQGPRTAAMINVLMFNVYVKFTLYVNVTLTLTKNPKRERITNSQRQSSE